MVRLNIVLTAGSARVADDLVEGLQFLARRTRLEPGCLGCSIWADRKSVV